MKALLLALLLTVSSFGQSVSGGGSSGGGGFIYTGVLSGLPATCTVGQIAFVTDATAGQNQYNCSATNTWTQNLNSGAGGASTALDNLAAVNINAALLFQSAKDVGSTAKPARNIFLYGAGTYSTTYIELTGTPTSTRVLTLPNVTDTLVGKATTDTLTNKTFDTAGTGNSFSINGTSISAVTGTGSAVLATSPTLTTPVFSSIVNTGTLTLPTTSDTLVGRATTDTLTNKTLTAPTMTAPILGVATATSINKVTITAPATSATITITDGKTLAVSNTLTFAGTDGNTLTFPSGSDTVVTLGATQTLTGKTLTTPTIASFTNATHDHSNAAGGGTLTSTGVATGSKEGNGTKFAMFTGADPATDDCAKFDVNHNLVTAGGACGAGGGGISALTGDVTASGTGSVAATVVNLPAGVTMAGRLLATNVVAPATPAAGKTAVYIDSTSKVLCGKNDAGTVGCAVVADTGASNQFLTAISAAGVISKAQPTILNLATFSSANFASQLSDGTGSGSVVFSTSPTFVTPTLGVANATTINKVTLTAPATGSTLTIADGKTLTASNTLTFTGTDASSVAFGTGGTATYTSNNLSVFAATTSAQLAGVISDETGSGSLAFATSPTLVTPVLGVATATSINKVAFTAPATAATLTIANNKTLTISNTMTLAGGDSTVMTFPNATATVLTTNAAVTVPQGGTGVASFTAHGVLVGNTASSLSVTAAGTSGQVLTSNGASSDPTWQAAGAGTVTVSGAGSLTSTAFMTGAGTTVSQTPSATSTLDSSGNAVFAGTLTAASISTASGASAGFYECTQGTAPSNGTTSIRIACPASVTSYHFILPGTSATGLLLGTNVSNENTLTFASTSAAISGAISDETGTGVLVFATSPTLVTPVLGVATATSINKVTLTAPATAATLTIANNKTVTINNTMTFAGGDSSVITFPNATTTVLTTNAAVTVAQGGTGVATLAAHGVLVGAGTSNVAVTTAGTSGQVLTSNGASADPTWQAAGSGTVSSIVFSSPLTGGTVTTTGTVGCATCVTSAAALTNNQLVFGAGSQATAVGDLTGDVTTAGGKATTLANIPTAVPMAGYIAATAIVAPGTPSAGVGRIYEDSTSKNLAIKDDAGVVKHGVQTKTAVTSNFLTAISDDGLVTAAQPAFTDISGIATPAQVSSTVNSQTGTTYTFVDSDRGKLVTGANASSQAYTLPQAGQGGNFLTGWFMDVQNTGVGTITITPTTSTVDGAATIALGTKQGARIFSDGSNYFTQRGDSSGATIASPTFTGSAVAPTQSQNDNSTKLATTAYTDLAVSNAIAGVNPAVAVAAASTASLTGTYSNGASGVGATFTVTATGAFTLDGISIGTVGQRVLLKNQSTAFQNGVYSATVVGTTGVSPIFTRATDYNQPSDINNTGSIPVVGGTVNAATSWLLTSTVSAVGTDSLTYTQFTLNPSNLVSAVSPGVGLAHFAGSTQTATSSLVVSSDLNITTTTCTNQLVSAISAGGVGTCHTIAQADLPATTRTRAIAFSIGDASNSSALTTSSVSSPLTVPFACTISAYNLGIDAGTITVKFWKIATGTAIPTVSNVINTSGVGVASGTAIHSGTVTDFTSTTVTANDIIIMAVTAVATAKEVTGVLQCDQ